MLKNVTFRVWDEVKMKMYYPGKDGTQIIFGVKILSGEFEFHEWQLWDEEGLITKEGKGNLMLKTGFKDEKGNDIYINDIVKEKGKQVFHDDPFDYGKEYSLQEVKYDEVFGVIIIGNLEARKYINLFTGSLNVEIIGNKYGLRGNNK